MQQQEQVPPLRQEQNLPPPQQQQAVGVGNAREWAQLHDDVRQMMATIREQQAAIDLLRHAAAPQHHPRATVKLPPFPSGDPQLWFSQVEALFLHHAIADEVARYSCVVGHLDERVASEVADLIRTPPVAAPYTTLKRTLIDRIGVPDRQRVRQLLSGEEMGDRTPSKFLRDLRSLSTAAIPDELLRTIWLQRLPPHVQAVLQAHELDAAFTIDRLAAVADRVLEVSPTMPRTFATVASISTGAPSSTPPTLASPSVNAVTASSADTTAARLDELSRQLNALRESCGARSRYRSKTPPRRRGSPSARPRSPPADLCWFHRRFGRNAKKCSPPCSSASNSNGNRH